MSIGLKMSKDQKKFYRALFALVIPITIQNFISNAVNSADVFMLGYVGQEEQSVPVSALGLLFWHKLRSNHAWKPVLG